MGVYRNSNTHPDIDRRFIRYGCLRTYCSAIRACPIINHSNTDDDLICVI